MDKTVLLICDMWQNHWCTSFRQTTMRLAEDINDFAKTVRRHNGRVLHCPSGVIESHYGNYEQRKSMLQYPEAGVIVPQGMRCVDLPLDTSLTAGCSDFPTCDINAFNPLRQHDDIDILPQDLISDSGQEIYNFLIEEKIEKVLLSGAALNMCILGRPFGAMALLELGFDVYIVGDLVENFYSPTEPPYLPVEQAKWFTLGYIESKRCPITTIYREIKNLPEEKSVKIHSNIPGPLLSRLKQEHKLEYFVETGTAGGDTAELAATMFKKVWTCDIDLGLVQRAENRLKEYTNIEISNEASPNFLRRIKPELLTQPVMYWLDAHWCGGPTKPAKECPLLEELEAIRTFFGFNGYSVILIDDINLIEEPPKPPHDPKQWPTMEELRATLGAWGEPFAFEWYQGEQSKVLIITPINVEKEKAEE